MTNASALAKDLRRLGLPPGRDVLVHCAMGQIGWIDGDAEALLAAIREVSRATVVVMTQTTLSSPTSRAFAQATVGMDAAAKAAFIQQAPAFDPDSPPVGMGRLADHILAQPGVTRSAHPLASFAALGERADEYTRVHELDCLLGEKSPLGRLYAEDASILLLGVGYTSCSALHLAEYRVPGLPEKEYSCLVLEDGQRVRKRFREIDLNDKDFDQLGADLEAGMPVSKGKVGAATSRVLRMRSTVDFAVKWLLDNRERRVP